MTTSDLLNLSCSFCFVVTMCTKKGHQHRCVVKGMVHEHTLQLTGLAQYWGHDCTAALGTTPFIACLPCCPRTQLGMKNDDRIDACIYPGANMSVAIIAAAPLPPSTAAKWGVPKSPPQQQSGACLNLCGLKPQQFANKPGRCF